jgi:hypothetical protein
MKKLLELITEEFEKAFEKNEYDKKLGRLLYLTGLTFVSISVMGQWQVQSFTTRHLL